MAKLKREAFKRGDSPQPFGKGQGPIFFLQVLPTVGERHSGWGIYYRVTIKRFV